MRRVAIIGAGLSGLTLAHALQSDQVDVTVFDKSRGPGGRCATRRNSAGWFDHGAPHAQAVSPAFSAHLHDWQSAGWLNRVDDTPGPDPQWVGAPFMNAWMRHCAQGLKVCSNTHIAALERQGSAWALRGLEGPELQPAPRTLFDAVVVAVPAEQAAPLLQADPDMVEALRGTHSDPCWTVMAAWPNPLPVSSDFWQHPDPLLPLAMAVRQDRRPGRAHRADAPTESAAQWVLHAGAQWSAHNLDAKPEAVISRLLDAMATHAGVRLARPSWSGAHRWRYAQVPTPRAEPAGWNAELQLGACGDAWHAMPGAHGLERAWLSAMALAQMLQPKG